MRVTGLFAYPLKSARGISLDEASLDGFGIRGDRRWAIVGPDCRIITQRDVHALAALVAQPVERGLVLCGPGGSSHRVDRPDEGPREPVRVWESDTEGVSAGPEAEAWISRFMGRPGRIMYMPDSVRRPVARSFAEPGDRVGFADGFPLLLTTEASLAVLNDRLDAPVPMNRFRPNMVVDGEAPFGEDRWTVIRAGGTRFRVVKPCPRCVVITVDQRSGTAGKEPLRTLAEFRRRDEDGKVLFGQNLIHDGPGVIRLGDVVEVVKTRG
jgi:uncharacterized protein YcbX